VALRYIDCTLVVWPHCPGQLQNFLNHLNNMRFSIQFTKEIELDSEIHFLDILVIRKGITLVNIVYRKPTHTGQYLNFKSNQPTYEMRFNSESSQQSFHHMKTRLFNKISNLRCDIQLSGYPQSFIYLCINSRLAVVQRKRKSLWDLCIRHM
jgi:hypothetical protein